MNHRRTNRLDLASKCLGFAGRTVSRDRADYAAAAPRFPCSASDLSAFIGCALALAKEKPVVLARYRRWRIFSKWDVCVCAVENAAHWEKTNGPRGSFSLSPKGARVQTGMGRAMNRVFSAARDSGKLFLGG
jgi:hypothetical protein